MSRSLWAAAGAWSPATAGRGAVSQQRLEDGRLERGRLLSVAHLSRALLSVAAATVLALALEPASARAQRFAVTNLALAGTHAKPGARARVAKSVPANRTAGTLLAPGDGEQSPFGSGRVRALQRQLARAGEWPGPVDGRYGPLTEQAVRHFQGTRGLQIDGIAGPRTLTALSAPTPLFPGAGYQPGGSGRVRALQRNLARLGDAPGPIDGRYGPLTEQAIRRFQGNTGLRVDGIAGPLTLTRLHAKTPVHVHGRARSHPRSVPRPARPKAPLRRAATARPAKHDSRAGHSSGQPSQRWLLPLGALVLGLLLFLGWYTRARRIHNRSDRIVPARPAGGTAATAARLERPGGDRLSEALTALAANERRTANRPGRRSPAAGAQQNSAHVVGYARVSKRGGAGRRELEQQTDAIDRECERLGLELVEVIGEHGPADGRQPSRPGLAYALKRISGREAQGLVVAELSRLSDSAAELDTIMETLDDCNAQLFSAAHPPEATSDRRSVGAQASTNRPRRPTALRHSRQRRGSGEERGM